MFSEGSLDVLRLWGPHGYGVASVTKRGFLKFISCYILGQSGLGKSTLINTLFKSKISRKSVQPSSEERIPKTIEIKSITHGECC